MSSARKRKWAVKSETVVPTEPFLHHKLLHLKAGPCSEPMEHRTKAHTVVLCVYSIDAWCSNTVKVDGQCFQDVVLLI